MTRHAGGHVTGGAILGSYMLGLGRVTEPSEEENYYYEQNSFSSPSRAPCLLPAQWTPISPVLSACTEDLRTPLLLAASALLLPLEVPGVPASFRATSGRVQLAAGSGAAFPQIISVVLATSPTAAVLSTGWRRDGTGLGFKIARCGLSGKVRPPSPISQFPSQSAEVEKGPFH